MRERELSHRQWQLKLEDYFFFFFFSFLFTSLPFRISRISKGWSEGGKKEEFQKKNRRHVRQSRVEREGERKRKITKIAPRELDGERERERRLIESIYFTVLHIESTHILAIVFARVCGGVKYFEIQHRPTEEVKGRGEGTQCVWA